MSVSKLIFAATIALAAATLSQAAPTTGIEWIDNNTNLTFYGDLRLRYEMDWDSQNATGVERDDRHRGRVRARVGFNYQITDDWSVGSRVRTGDSRSQQSPHLTFASEETRDELDFVVDRYFVQYKHDAFSGWAGRNITPFWFQNELFWDEDATPTGVAGSYETRAGAGTLHAVAGGFFLPDGGYDLNGQMLAGQVRYTLPIDRSRLTTAGSLHFLNGESDANNLLNRNGERDYFIGIGSVQWNMPIQKVPFTLGADVFYNFMDYDAADVAPFPPEDDDEKLGYVLSAVLGQLRERHDWLLGYYYAHIETFAVNASYAQDDWFRFGSGSQTDSSDYEGHEIRVGYAISKYINLLARLYFVEAITTEQDGNRFRLDLNWRF